MVVDDWVGALPAGMLFYVRGVMGQVLVTLAIEDEFLPI